jgi:hypothetical protein
LDTDDLARPSARAAAEKLSASTTWAKTAMAPNRSIAPDTHLLFLKRNSLIAKSNINIFSSLHHLSQ